MSDIPVSAARLEACCHAPLDEVAAGPLVPSVMLLAEDDSEDLSTGEAWDADR